jgi:uncharacterized protein
MMGYQTGPRLSKKTVPSRRPAGPPCSFRGGPPGFLRILDDKALDYADFRSIRQYVATGTAAANDRLSLFLTDYAHQRRLKIFGRMWVADAGDDPALAAKLAVPDYPGRVERTVRITVETFDWSCPQHITPRWTEAERAEPLVPVRREMECCEREGKIAA